MHLLKKTGIYFLLLIFFIMSNGFMLIGNSCDCSDDVGIVCSIENSSCGETQSACCCTGNTDKGSFPSNSGSKGQDDCKCSFLFYKIPVYQIILQDNVISQQTNLIPNSLLPVPLFQSASINYLPKPIKPPGNVGRTINCMNSSFLL